MISAPAGPDNGPAGFHGRLQAALPEFGAQALDVRANRRGLFFLAIGNAQAAAQIQMRDRVPLRPQRRGQLQGLVHGLQNGARVEHLRADMAAYSLRRQILETPCSLVDRRRLANIDSEFVTAEPGGNIRVRGCVHIRIHANGEPGRQAAASGQGVDQGQFRFRLAVEAANAVLEGIFHFAGRLAHARKNHFRGIAARLKHAKQLAARNDIETRSRPRQKGQHRQRRIGLHGVTDQVRQIAQSFVVGAIVVENRLARIYVSGRARARCKVRQRDLLAIQIVSGIGEHRLLSVCHGGYFTTLATVWIAISTRLSTRRNSVLGSFMPHATKGTENFTVARYCPSPASTSAGISMSCSAP